MMYRLFIIAAFACLFSSHLYAQKKVYSLEEVWQKTLQQYPSLSSRQYEIEQQELHKNLIKKEQLPEVNVQAQQSYGAYQGVAGSFFPLPGIYNTSGSTKVSNGASSATSNQYASAVLQWNIIQFGKIQSKLKVADAAINRSNKAYSEEQLRLQSKAAELYFNVLQSTAFLTTAQADAQRLKDLLDLSKSQAEAGIKPGADTLLVKSNYYQVKGQVNEQQALLEASMLQLATLMNEDTASFAVDTTIYGASNIASVILPVEDSINNHPYLQYLQANIGYTQASLNSVKKQPYPSIGLLAGAGVRGSGINTMSPVDNSYAAPWKNNTGSYLVGVGVTWNLFSLYQNKTKQQIAERDIQAAKANYEDASLQIKAAYAAALSRWKQQQQKVVDAQTALEASQQAYDLYVTRYESGLINLIELLQLQKTLEDAENNLLKATAAYWNELINQSESSGNLSLLLAQIHSSSNK